MFGARWGVHDSETTLHYECDDFATEPALEAWRGVTVDAPAAAVWPWLGQIRVAPYSYDWIDNGGRRAPRAVLGLPEPRVGKAFTASAGRPLGRIVAVQPGTSLTATILGAFMTYRLVPTPDGTTRLLLKVVMETSRLVAPALCLGDLVMARRQLLNLKALAEQSCAMR
jgi:hypothetical protein